MIVLWYAQTPSTLLHAQTFFCMGKKSFTCAKFAQARQHVGHTPKSFMAGNRAGHSRLKQRPLTSYTTCKYYLRQFCMLRTLLADAPRRSMLELSNWRFARTKSGIASSARSKKLLQTSTIQSWYFCRGQFLAPCNARLRPSEPPVTKFEHRSSRSVSKQCPEHTDSTCK